MNNKKTNSKTENSKKINAPQKNKEHENWLSAEAFILLAVMFVVVESIGLYIAQTLFLQGLTQTSFTGNVNDVENSLILFGIMMVMTLVTLLLMKRTKKLLWLVEGLAIFSTSIIVFSAIFPTNDVLVILLTIALIAWRYTHKEDVVFRNVVSLIAIAGAGAYLGLSFGVIPVLAFICLLAIYDIIAVFYTKHMLEIGTTAVKNNFAFMVAIPTEKHTFELGNGDLVIPLVVASSVLINGNFTNNGLVAGLVLGASFVGLMFSIYSVSTGKKALPALPPQTLLMLIVIIVASLIGF
jgi:presenilin-like A22 family membrane protease